jgi:ethanolamine transporter EutH
MWPWAHAAVGYLLYVAYAHRQGLPLRGLPVLATLFGTQAPDLLDKPLAWTFAVLPAGRSLGHSLLFAVPLAVLCWYVVAGRFDRPAVALGAAVGYVSHLFADGLGAALAGRWADLSYLGWPVLALPEYELDPSFAAHFLAFEFDALTLLGFALTGLAAAVWLRLAAQARRQASEPSAAPTRE